MADMMSTGVLWYQTAYCLANSNSSTFTTIGDGSYGEVIHGHRAGPRVSVHLQADDQDEAGLGEPLEATIITTEKRGGALNLR
ncbi:protein sidekick-1-like isoform X2 [Mustela erminea]|uniref:protein sidekick-1-like isoform X2 n=1 Tax=Mustela erminea TaxID=36723 RepID=UPI0013867A92|nr:protein sidekick-1-like isoform X2 [Mustela erminea]